MQELAHLSRTEIKFDYDHVWWTPVGQNDRHSYVVLPVGVRNNAEWRCTRAEARSNSAKRHETSPSPHAGMPGRIIIAPCLLNPFLQPHPLLSVP